ncbi:MAG: trypsin-like peptidase domain-containing protein [Ferrovibrio sp.]|uniref:trypsin-like peptidase domain-containing protein n=1 Tax=Ferrovibrio sp. TaxID=1917215 RepID=UPI00391A74C2
MQIGIAITLKLSALAALLFLGFGNLPVAAQPSQPDRMDAETAANSLKSLSATLNPSQKAMAAVSLQNLIVGGTAEYNELERKLQTTTLPADRREIILEKVATQNRLDLATVSLSLLKDEKDKEIEPSPEQAGQIKELIVSLAGPLWVLCGGKPWLPVEVNDGGLAKQYAGFFARHPHLMPSIGRLSLFRVGSNGSPDTVYKRAGTAFAVHPQLLLTNRHVVIEGHKNGPLAYRRSDGSIHLYTDRWFVGFESAEAEGCKPKAIELAPNGIRVTGIAAIGKDDSEAEDWALLTIDPKYSLQPIAPSLGGPWTSGDVIVVGYPQFPPRGDQCPQSQGWFDKVNELFLAPDRERYELARRASPGNLVDYASLDWQVAHTANTAGGNSGSPIIRIKDGAFVGLHYGGNWNCDLSRLVNNGLSAKKLEPIISEVAGKLPTGPVAQR